VRRISSAAPVVVSSAAPARAQTIQTWLEISVFTRLNDRMRFYFLATTVKESRESTEGEFGPNFDVYLRPFKERKRLAGSAWMNRRTDSCCSGSVIDSSIPSAAIPTNIASCSKHRRAMR
jgi:hypothetical protein